MKLAILGNQNLLSICSDHLHAPICFLLLGLLGILGALGATDVCGAEGRHAAAIGFVLVANKGDQTLGIIDPVAGRQIATVPEDGKTGHEVAASADGNRVFVPIFGDSGVGKPGTDGQLIRVIDLAKRKVVGTIDLGKGMRPHCAVIGPKNNLLYVTTELDNSVTVIDPNTLKITGTIPTGQAESHMLAITRDGRRGYTANVGPGTVSVLDLEAKKVLAVIPVCRTTQRIGYSFSRRHRGHVNLSLRVSFLLLKKSRSSSPIRRS